MTESNLTNYNEEQKLLHALRFLKLQFPIDTEKNWIRVSKPKQEVVTVGNFDIKKSVWESFTDEVKRKITNIIETLK